MPKWLPAAVLAVVLFTLNVVAVNLFGEAEFWFALIKLVAVGALIIVAAWLLASRFVSPGGDAAQIANLWNDGGFLSRWSVSTTPSGAPPSTSCRA